jgi:hypothetical protein
MFLLILASQVARIIGVSHQHPAVLVVIVNTSGVKMEPWG